jgi:FAD/FMN-containing dehydrogenase
LPLSRSPAELALMRQIKRALDPNGILNPGRVLSG